MLTNALGQAFVRLYYEYSPPFAAVISGDENLRLATRLVLTPLVYAIKYPATSLGLIMLLIAYQRYRPFGISPG